MSRLSEWRSRSETWTNEVQVIIEKLSAEQEQQVLSNLTVNDRLTGLEQKVQKLEDNSSVMQATIAALQSVPSSASGFELQHHANLAERIESLEGVLTESAYKYAKDLQNLQEDSAAAVEKHINVVANRALQQERQFVQAELSRFSERLEVFEQHRRPPQEFLAQPDQSFLESVQAELSIVGGTVASLCEDQKAARLMLEQSLREQVRVEQARSQQGLKDILAEFDHRLDLCERKAMSSADGPSPSWSGPSLMRTSSAADSAARTPGPTLARESTPMRARGSSQAREASQSGLVVREVSHGVLGESSHGMHRCSSSGSIIVAPTIPSTTCVAVSSPLVPASLVASPPPAAWRGMLSGVGPATTATPVPMSPYLGTRPAQKGKSFGSPKGVYANMVPYSTAQAAEVINQVLANSV
jgi:hypothetical protein